MPARGSGRDEMASEEQWVCLRKRRYRRRSDARQAARRAQQDFGRMGVYHCPFCRWYHVGHPRRANPAGVDSPAMSDQR